jgi:hypothetical protein
MSEEEMKTLHDEFFRQLEKLYPNKGGMKRHYSTSDK